MDIDKQHSFKSRNVYRSVIIDWRAVILTITHTHTSKILKKLRIFSERIFMTAIICPPPTSLSCCSSAIPPCSPYQSPVPSPCPSFPSPPRSPSASERCRRRVGRRPAVGLRRRRARVRVNVHGLSAAGRGGGGGGGGGDRGDSGRRQTEQRVGRRQQTRPAATGAGHQRRDGGRRPGERRRSRQRRQSA